MTDSSQALPEVRGTVLRRALEASRQMIVLTPAEEGDLKWYFAGGDGDLGLRSSWESLCYRVKVGPDVQLGGQDGLNDERVFRAIGRWRRIERVLGRMPRESVRALKRWVTSAPGSAGRLEAVIGPVARVLAGPLRADALRAVEEDNRSQVVVWRARATADLLIAVRELRAAMTRRPRRDATEAA